MTDTPHDDSEHSNDTLTFYWGSTSGSAQKALRRVEEPRAMLSHVTKMNQRWDGIETLFADSGGYSMMNGAGEYTTTRSEYLDWVAEQDAELFVTRDYPCEPSCRSETGGSVRDHQQWTVENAIGCLDAADERDLDSRPVVVVQGWAENDYLEHIDMLRDHGVFGAVDYVAIGSVCRRGQTDRIRRIIKSVASELPDHDLHGFGVKLDVLRDSATRKCLTSADSCAWYQRSHSADSYTPHLDSWLHMVRLYIDYRDKLDPLRFGATRQPDQHALSAFTTD